MNFKIRMVLECQKSVIEAAAACTLYELRSGFFCFHDNHYLAFMTGIYKKSKAKNT